MEGQRGGHWPLDACGALQEENVSPEVHARFFPGYPVWDLPLCQVCFIFRLDEILLPSQNPLFLSLTEGTEDQDCNSPGWWFSNCFSGLLGQGEWVAPWPEWSFKKCESDQVTPLPALRSKLHPGV